MTQINPIPFSLLLLLTFFAAVIFLVFKIGRQYVLPLIKQRKNYRFCDRWIFRGELLAWALFLIFALYRLFIASPYLTIVFIALAIIVGRAFWKDFIPGLLFRLENNAENGDSIRYGSGNCTIEAFGPRNLQLRNKEGEIIILPYSHIEEAVIAKSVQKSRLHQFTFKVMLKNGNPSTDAALLQQYIQECPWSIPARQPTIDVLGNGQYEITSFATDENTAGKQQVYVEERLMALAN